MNPSSAPMSELTALEIESRKRPPAENDFHRWLDEQKSENKEKPQDQEKDEEKVLVSTLQILRTSSTDKNDFLKNFDVATAARSEDPDVAKAREVGPEIVLTHRQDMREEHSAYKIRMCDLPGGEDRDALVGYAVRFGETVFLYVMNSAAESTLDADHEEERRNPFTEALKTAVRRLSHNGWEADDSSYQLRLEVPGHTRLTRNQRHAMNVWSTLQWARCDLVVDGMHVNTDSSDDELVYSIMSGITAKELKTIVRRLFSARIAILSAGKYYNSIDRLPFTHEAATMTRTENGRTWIEKDIHTPVPIHEAGKKLAELVDKAIEFAESNPDDNLRWKALARFAGQQLGIETRYAKHQARGGLPIHEASSGGENAIKGLLASNYIKGWLTGTIYTQLLVPEVARDRAVLFDDAVKIIKCADNRHRYRIPVDFPRPEIECDDPDGCGTDWHHDLQGDHKTHGWPVTDARLIRLLDLRTSNSKSNTNRGGRDVRSPLAGITGRGYVDGDRQIRIASTSERYKIEARPLPEDPGTGWCTIGATDHLYTLRNEDLHRSVGQALQQALMELADNERSLELPRTTSPSPEGDYLDHQIAEARQQVDGLENAVKGADYKHCQALGANDGDQEHESVKEAQQRLDDLKADLAQARDRLEHLQEQVDADDQPDNAIETQQATVDLNDPATIAVAIQKATDPAPKELNELIKTAIDSKSVRFESVPDTANAKVRWKMTWRLRDADSGRWLELPLTGTVTNTSRKGGRRTHGAQAGRVGKLYFRDGRTFEEVARLIDSVDTDKRKKNSHLWHLLHDFLREHVTVDALRTALIDTPADMGALRKVAYALVTEETSCLKGIAKPYADHIISTYTQAEDELPHRWGWHWVGSTHVHARALLAAIENRGCHEVGINIPDAISVTGTSRSRLLAVARRRRTKPSKGSALPNIPPRIERTWNRTDRLDDEDRYFKPYVCPHPDCSGNLGGKTAYLMHTLWTPETWEDSLICTHCRRTPSSSSVIFPDEYLQPWRGRVGPDDAASGARDHAGTHLDPAHVKPCG